MEYQIHANNKVTVYVESSPKRGGGQITTNIGSATPMPGQRKKIRSQPESEKQTFPVQPS